MSLNQNTLNKLQQKTKRGSMNRPQSFLIDSDLNIGFRSDIENDCVIASKTKVLNLLKQIEREFDYLYIENQTLQERIESLNEKLERDIDKPDCIDLDNTISKNLSKKLSTSSQKSKTAQKLKAQTSRIVKNFKTPYSCNLLKEFNGHADGVWEVSVARPGVPIIGTASADHSACIWSVETGRCILQYQGHTGSVNSIRFHPSKDLILTSSGDWSTHIWQAALNWDFKGTSSEEDIEGDETEDISTLRTPYRELTGHSGAVSGAEWLIGGDQVITGSWDRLAILHDVETGANLQVLSGHDQELTHTATHPNQRLAVTSSRDMTFRLWDFREAVHSVSVFQGHVESVTSTVFAKEDYVVSSSDDRTVKIWDLKNMRSPVATIRVDSAVNRLAVSSNGIIAMPHDSRNIRLFDLNGQRLTRLPRSRRQGHTRMVSSAAWAENGVFGINLFTSGFDKRVLGWSVSLRDQ